MTISAPTVTAPTSGDTISNNTGLVAWMGGGSFDRYQVRLVGDIAGSPDPTTVYYDSGPVIAADFNATIDYPVPGVPAHVQVAVGDSGGYTDFADADVPVTVWKILFRSMVSSPFEGNAYPDPVTGAGYIVLPQPEGLEVGDLMVTVGSNTTDESNVGLIPVGSGWTTIPRTTLGADYGRQWISYKIATADDIAAPTLQFGPLSVDLSVLGQVAWLAYHGDIKTVTVALGAFTVTAGDEGLTATAPVTARADGTAVTVFITGGKDPAPTGTDPSTTGTAVEQRIVFPTADASGILVAGFAVCDEPVAATDTSVAVLDASDPDNVVVVALGVALMLEGAHAPNTPTITAPRTGATYTTLEDIPLALTPFTSIDIGDGATASEFRYELVSGGSWTDIAGDTDGTGVIAAGTLAAGSWQVEGNYTGQSALTSDWSAARAFTVIDPPTSPVITTPTTGATITTPTGTVDWTVTDQDAYELQVVADDSGTADPSIVYWDSGLIVASGTRTTTAHYTILDPTATVAVHLRARIQYEGHYSAWADVPLTVEYTKPDKPVITGIIESDGDAAIQIDYTTAVDSIPSDATEVTLYASEDDGATRYLILTHRPVNSSEIWYLPPSGRGETFQVEAVNAYGAVNASDWDGTTTGTAGDLRTTMYVAGGAFPE